MATVKSLEAQVAELTGRVTLLEELLKASLANRTVVHKPAFTPDPVGTYPHVDGRGRHYRNSGPHERAYAPAPQDDIPN